MATLERETDMKEHERGKMEHQIGDQCVGMRDDVQVDSSQVGVGSSALFPAWGKGVENYVKGPLWIFEKGDERRHSGSDNDCCLKMELTRED